MPVLHRIRPLLMANDRHCVKRDFYASIMLLVVFYLFVAALAAVQLLTWSCSAGVSPGLLGGFVAGKSVCSCCSGAAWWGDLRSIK